MSRRDWLIALSVLALLLALRVVMPTADPPADMEGHFLSDEGLWAHNARQRALFGQWVMDEHNPPLFQTPLYSGALWLVYETLGVGLLQTRLLTIFAGWLSCVVVFLVVRRWSSTRTALLATALFGTDYFVLTYHRVAFVEGFQLLFIVSAAATLVSASRNERWAVAAGALTVLAVLAKLSSVSLLLVIAVYWCLRFLIPLKEAGERRPPVREALYFSVGALVTSAGLLATLAAPYWMVARAEVEGIARVVAGDSLFKTIAGFGRFGLHLGPTVTPNAFILQTPVLIAATALLAIALIVRSGKWRPTALEMFCWCWIAAGAIFVAAQSGQPDRRYLFLVPPMAILVADALARGGIPLPARSDFARGAWRSWVVGGLAGWYAGLYLRHLLIPPIQRVTADLTLGVERGLGPQPAGVLAWLPFIATGVLAAGVARRWLPSERRRIPAYAVILLLCVVGPVRFLLYASHPTFTVRDSAERLAELTEGWAETDRVIMGNMADTLAMESDLFAFIIRRQPEDQIFMNLDGWERFRPSLVLAIGGEERPTSSEFVRLRDLELCPNRSGDARFRVEIYARSSFVAANPAWVGEFADPARPPANPGPL